MSKRWFAAGAVALAFLAVPSAEAAKKTSKFDASVATDWFDLLYDRVKAEAIGPPPASRIYGIAAVTLYEAVQPGMKKTHESLVGQLNGLDALPQLTKKQRKKMHWPTVANYALHTVLSDLFEGKVDSIAAFDALRDATDASFGLKQKKLALASAHGVALGNAIIAWCDGDGYAENVDCDGYVPGNDPGDWTPTPPAMAPASQPCWGAIRPMVLTDGAECAPIDPPTYVDSTLDPVNFATSLFYTYGLEVYAVGKSLTDEQKAIANFWADNGGTTGTPPGHSIDIVRQITIDQGLNLADAATAFARVGIAVNDAFIACWNAKYVHNLLRPITYIQSEIDPTWLPLLTTPPFPEYPSGHSTQSGASSVALEDAFGFGYEFTDRLHSEQNPELDFPDRTFESFEDAAREAVVSRMYGGIHYRPANDNGFEQGRCIGETIRDSVEFVKGEDGPAPQ